MEKQQEQPTHVVDQTQPIDLREVRITFLRIQTYLLAVPRLREMVGSNVQLGEEIRLHLLKIAKNNGAQCPKCLIPKGDFFDQAIRRVKSVGPGASANKDLDPLNTAIWNIYRDDPYDLLSQRGVTARDGGHFAAIFIDEQQAKAFARQAKAHLRRELPGLPYEVRIKRLDAPNNQDEAEPVLAVQPLDLPFFQVCQATGTGPAAEKDLGSQELISKAVQDRLSKADNFFRRKSPRTSDIAGLLYRHFLPVKNLAPDFGKLADGGYLAVIHADGNGMGARGHAYKQCPEYQNLTNPVERALFEERLFYGMRIAVRRAVVDAINKTFNQHKGEVRPYQVLMLGGDDLLLVCQAAYALRFVVNYATELQQYELIDEKSLSIGAGVVLAAPNIPFHHLHALAEKLAESAKRLFRQQQNNNPSVVDWMVCTYSWSDDPIQMRKAASRKSYGVPGGNGAIQEEVLVLTGKPYPVLGEDIGSLQGLLTAAEQIQQPAAEGGKAARSQLRRLVDELGKGKRWSELLYQELPEGTRKVLNDSLGTTGLWRQKDDANQAGQLNHWLTRLGDLVEITEIPRLGSRS